MFISLFVSFFTLIILVTEPCYRVVASLKLTLWPRLPQNLWQSLVSASGVLGLQTCAANACLKIHFYNSSDACEGPGIDLSVNNFHRIPMVVVLTTSPLKFIYLFIKFFTHLFVSTGHQCVAQTGLKLWVQILEPPQLPKCWNFRSHPQNLASHF